MWIVKWTDIAKEQYQDVLLFWKNHNKSNSYPKKIRKSVQDIISKLVINPFIGQEYTDKEEIESLRRFVLLNNFSIFYQIEEDSNILKIVSFWDNRRDPESLKLKEISTFAKK